jgi:uncharacterized membrane protein YjjP (DUF1212 family)
MISYIARGRDAACPKKGCATRQMTSILNSVRVLRAGVFLFAALEVVLTIIYVTFLRTRRTVNVRLLGAVITVVCFISILLAQRKLLHGTGAIGLVRTEYDLLVAAECAVCFVILLYGLVRSTTHANQC